MPPYQCVQGLQKGPPNRHKKDRKCESNEEPETGDKEEPHIGQKRWKDGGVLSREVCSVRQIKNTNSKAKDIGQTK